MGTKKEAVDGLFFIKILERVTGIEPVLFAWEANVIPFHHTRSGVKIIVSWQLSVKFRKRPFSSCTSIFSAYNDILRMLKISGK